MFHLSTVNSILYHIALYYARMDAAWYLLFLIIPMHSCLRDYVVPFLSLFSTSTYKYVLPMVWRPFVRGIFSAWPY